MMLENGGTGLILVLLVLFVFPQWASCNLGCCWNTSCIHGCPGCNESNGLISGYDQHVCFDHGHRDCGR